QLCSFRDDYETLRALGASVLAVSVDDLESHRRFAERVEGLPFPLASDADLAVTRAYDVVDPDDSQRSQRAVFVVGTDGVILDAIAPYQNVPDQFAAVFRALGFEL